MAKIKRGKKYLKIPISLIHSAEWNRDMDDQGYTNQGFHIPMGSGFFRVSVHFDDLNIARRLLTDLTNHHDWPTDD